MKKLLIGFVSAALLLGTVACNKGASKPSTDSSSQDSLATAMAIYLSGQVRSTMDMLKMQGNPVDSIHVLKGFKESINDSTRFSYFLGGIMGAQMRKDLEADGIDLKKFFNTFQAALLNDTLSISMSNEESHSFLQKFQEKKQEAAMMEQYGKNKEAGASYMDAFKKDEGVQTTASGLAYKVITPGTGKTPSNESTVKVKYVGTTVDGKEFDKNEEGIEFGVTGVIAGWTEMLQLMKEGEKVRVVIPYDLAYGSRGNYSIEPFSTLIFDMELIQVK